MLMMMSRILKLFSDNNLIYSLQFGFRQKYSAVHSLKCQKNETVEQRLKPSIRRLTKHKQQMLGTKKCMAMLQGQQD